jgi:hypothetical protein
MTFERHDSIYGYPGLEIIEITLPESLLMNHIERNPGTSPSRLCNEAGLRTCNSARC